MELKVPATAYNELTVIKHISRVSCFARFFLLHPLPPFHLVAVLKTRHVTPSDPFHTPLSRSHHMPTARPAFTPSDQPCRCFVWPAFRWCLFFLLPPSPSSFFFTFFLFNAGSLVCVTTDKRKKTKKKKGIERKEGGEIF